MPTCMAVTVRLNLDDDQVEIGNDEIGFGTFDATSKDIAWARRFAEYLEEQGVETEVEET